MRTYPMTVHAPRRARTDARMLLLALGWDGDVDDATLAVSELVANAYQHANTAGPELRLRLAVLTDGALLLEVSDPLPGFMPRIPHPERGRGLPLLDRLAKRVDWYLHGDDTRATAKSVPLPAVSRCVGRPGRIRRPEPRVGPGHGRGVWSWPG